MEKIFLYLDCFQTILSVDFFNFEIIEKTIFITQEVFKSKGAGEGFRRFQHSDGKYLKILKAHDLATNQPFECATNKTAAIVLKKEKKSILFHIIFGRRKKPLVKSQQINY